jgi:hypothetical protein
MTPSIKLRPEVYREVGRFGNRDESWNTVFLRLLEHVDEEAALGDRDGRQTTDERGTDPSVEKDHPLLKLDDGTALRHHYQRGDYSGEEVEAEVRGGKVHYGGEHLSPSGAAIEADKDIRGEDAGSAHNGWTWWSHSMGDGYWQPIDNLRE